MQNRRPSITYLRGVVELAQEKGIDNGSIVVYPDGRVEIQMRGTSHAKEKPKGWQI